MEPVTAISVGIAVAVVSGSIGKVWGNNNKVKQGTCEERRLACSSLISAKIDSLAEDIREIKEAVKHK